MAGDLGSIFGLDEFGFAITDLNNWAGPIGAGLQTAGAIAAAKFASPSSKLSQYAEIAGAGLGVAAGAALWFTGRRDAGIACGLSALIVGGLRQAAASGMFGSLNGNLSGYVVENMPAFSGLGMHTVESMPSLNGLGELPQLMGSYGLGDNPAAAQVQLQGGPSISGLGSHFGSTLFSA